VCRCSAALCSRSAAAPKEHPHHAGSRALAAHHLQPGTVTSHPLPAAGEEIFHRVANKARILPKVDLGIRPSDVKRSLMKQQSMAAELPATAASVHVLRVLPVHLQGAKRTR
jgi:hypothetical protein